MASSLVQNQKVDSFWSYLEQLVKALFNGLLVGKL